MYLVERTRSITLLLNRGQVCDFSIFSSPAAFEVCLDQAKETEVVFEEGDWDESQGAESRVWRSVEPQTLKNGLSSSTSTDAKSGD
jgi:hypothetical protein